MLTTCGAGLHVARGAPGAMRARACWAQLGAPLGARRLAPPRRPAPTGFVGGRNPPAWSPAPPARSLSAAAAAAQGAFPPPPPLASEDQPVWTDEVWASPLDVRRRIFCNRSLNMRSIKAVGFDMDYTIAQYLPNTFETLAYEQTVEKLIQHFGYPKLLRGLCFDWEYMARGLVIDKQRGNILKVDRHKYVKLAYHGFAPLSRDQRMHTYNDAGRRLDYEEPDFALIDTLFSLAEAHLFMQLVEVMDAQPGALPAGKSYADLYRDVRGAVDLCHRDGSIKREVAARPERYVHADPGLAPLLRTLRDSGKKVFLATNSLWDYTHVVMNYVLCGKAGADRDFEWLEHFDVVLTGCGKPRFFTDRKDLFEVHPSTGMLWNTEGGSPMVPIGEQDISRPLLASTAPAKIDAARSADGRARVFQGGFYLDLHKMLGVASGSQVLYVGDHVYGDILRSKKDLGWRTALVVPELEAELEVLARCKGNMAELRVLRQQRDALDDQIQRLDWALSHGIHVPSGSGSEDSGSGLARAEAEEEEGLDEAGWQEVIANLREQRDLVRARHRTLLEHHHSQFHPVWGQLLKTGYQNSQYAHQMERFACLYTSHVSNFLWYSPLKSYKARLDSMAHEEEPCMGSAATDDLA